MSAQPGRTGVTRALACLALEHDGDDESCPSSDEELAQALVREVQLLRVLARPDEEGQENALAVAMTEVAIAELPDEEQPGAILDMLAEAGWSVTRIRRGS